MLRRACISACRFSAIRPMTFVRAFATKKFTKDHEFILADGNQCTVGITDFAQKQLGDIVFCELPKLGTEFSKGSAFATVESVKATSSVYAPVDFKVTEVNSKVTENTALINQAAETDAWMAKGEIKNPTQLNELMDEAAYAKHCENCHH